MSNNDSEAPNPDSIDQVDLPNSEVSSFDISQLPASFQKFLKDNSIDPEIYTVANLPRYVRLNTHLPIEKRPTLEDLRTQLKTTKVHAVEGLDNFFSIQLSDTKMRISDIPA
jgi:hypothetical protein